MQLECKHTFFGGRIVRADLGVIEMCLDSYVELAFSPFIDLRMFWLCAIGSQQKTCYVAMIQAANSK